MGALCANEDVDLFLYTANKDDNISQIIEGIPKVSHCYRHTVLNLIPSVFLLLFSPLVIYAFSKSKNGPLYRRNPVTIRQFTCCILAFLVFVQLCYFSAGWYAGGEVILENSNAAHPTAEFFTLLLLEISLGMALLLLIGSVRYGLVTSGVLFNYWLLLAVCGAPELRTTLETFLSGTKKEHDYISSTLFGLYYIVVLATLVMSCFPDRPKNLVITKKTNPERCVSFINQITFWWFTPLASKGNARSLEFDDLWDLSESDKSQHLLSKFDRIRTKQFADYEKKRKDVKLKRSAKNVVEETELLEPNEKNSGNNANTEAGDGDKREAPSIIWPLILTFKWTIAGAILFKFVYDLFQFVPPKLLDLIISFMENREQNIWDGVGIALAMFVISLVQSMFLHQFFHRMFRLGMNVRSVLTSVVYKKALLLSNGARKKRTIGEIVNLMTVDIQRFQDISLWIMYIWSAPLQIALSVFFLWRLLGISAIAGVICLLALVPLNSKLSMILRRMQQKQMALKDERIKLLNEMLSGIRVLKLYAWEQSIENRILAIRQKELSNLKKMAYVNAISTMSWASATFLVAIATFAVYILIDPAKNILTPRITFVAISYINILRFPLGIFPMLTSQAVQCHVSNKRMKTFLAEEEIRPVSDRIEDPEVSIEVRNGSFSWDLEGPLVLRDIDVSVKKGSLVAIVGRIGSGKSSLLSAILGEMYRQSGTIGIDGRVAYVPQQAWIQNMTLKDNILFGCPLDLDKYGEAIDTCALGPDLATLPGGDGTEIGEKGINLSGGQKQRISLARAAYSQSDVYFLDDPLSAVDSHVGKHIFEKLISSETGILRGKTRLLVTHGLSFLKYCDQIIVIKDGQVSESGTYLDLLRASGEFSNLIEEYLQNKSDDIEGVEVLEELKSIDPEKHSKIDRQLSEKATRAGGEQTKTASRQTSQDGPQDVPSSATSPKKLVADQAAQNGDIAPSAASKVEVPNKTKIIEKEEMFTGKVKFRVYLSYLRAVSFIICAVFIFIYVIAGILGVICNLWLARWTDQAQEIQMGDTLSSETIWRLGVYAILGVTEALLIAFGSAVMALGMIRAGQKLHRSMLSNILRNATSWFDVTPLGRIMNRFSKDIHVVDMLIPGTLLNFLGSFVFSVVAIAIPIVVVPWNGPLFLALLLPYIWLLDVDNLDSDIPRSFMSFLRTFIASIEIIAMISYATPQFLVVILPVGVVYGIVLRFYVSTSRQLKRLESTTRSPIYSYFQESVQGASSIRAYNSVDRFLIESQRRVDTNICCYFPSIVSNRWLAVRLELVGNSIVFFSALSAVLFRNSDNLTPGLAGLSISYALSITQTLNWAVRMTSELETNIVAVERINEYSDPKANEAAMDTPKQIQLHGKWPDRGEIHFENLALRYRPDLDLVLKGVTARINPREKIGIIGRTGAGKSSLTLALFRLVEPCSGRILIDDVDIAQLGLRDLRSRLTIVPQDPVVFSGTVRDNLDPFSQHESADIWAALELTHLDEFVRSLPDKLEHKISEGGGNLSVGQRQLICLARALLRQPKILVLDEAAASVDIETDHLLQSTIRAQFRDCTVLTIAHRLHSVLDSDRILVFSEGRIVEFDSPQNLFAQPASLFRALAMDAGITSIGVGEQEREEKEEETSKKDN